MPAARIWRRLTLPVSFVSRRSKLCSFVSLAATDFPDARRVLPFGVMARVEAEIAAQEASLLVVDDEPAVLKVTQRILERRGYRVTACHSAEEALALLEKGEFDVVLSDVQMPGMGGLGLLRAVRELEAELPVILVTGNPSPETESKALEHGAFQYLSKPVNQAVLDQVVSEAANSSRQSRRRLLYKLK